MHLVGGQEMDIALLGNVVAVAIGTGIGTLPTGERREADGTAEQAHRDASFKGRDAGIWASHCVCCAADSALLYQIFSGSGGIPSPKDAASGGTGENWRFHGGRGRERGWFSSFFLYHFGMGYGIIDKIMITF